jgi:hypothetical protein
VIPCFITLLRNVNGRTGKKWGIQGEDDKKSDHSERENPADLGRMTIDTFYP